MVRLGNGAAQEDRGARDRGDGRVQRAPVGEVVVVDLSALQGNEVSFACGMNMLKGKVLVQ